MNVLRKYFRGITENADHEEQEFESDEYESASASSDGSYDDCAIDDESGDDKKKKKKGSTGNCVCPPVPSTATGAVVSSDLEEPEGPSFIALDPTDDFDQSITPFKSANLPQILTSSSFGQTKGWTVYKKELHTFCQMQQLELPFYTHTIEGPGHVLKFKAAVIVNGERYESPDSCIYSSKGDAEQAAAKAALSSLRPQHINQDLPHINLKSKFTVAAPNIAPSFASCTGFATTAKCFSTQQDQQMLHSAPSKLSNGSKGNFHVKKNSYAVEGLGVYTDIPDMPAPFADSTNLDDSHRKPRSHGLNGASGVPLKCVKPEGQVRTKAGTFEDPIDLSEDEQSVGSPSPVSTQSSPNYSTRSESAGRSEKQLWEALNIESGTFKGASNRSLQKQQPPISSDCLAVTNNHVNEITEGFSGLQVTSNKTPSMGSSRPWQQQQSVPWPKPTQQLRALGKLEFSTHAFPLLTRLNGQPLEEAYEVGDIEFLKDIPSNEVYRYLSYVDGVRRRDTTKVRPPVVNSDPCSLLYDCYVSPTGEMRFEVAENNQGTNILQRKLGYDKVLRVFFEGFHCPWRTAKIYKDIGKSGIFVGCRFYQFCVYKGSDDISNDKEKRSIQGAVKCYFVCTDSQGEADLQLGFRRFETVAVARSLFMHIGTTETVAKYIKRSQLTLTKSMTIKDMPWKEINMVEKKDLSYKDTGGALFTDGTGFISADLAKLIPISVFKGMTSEESQGNDVQEDYPTLVQVRLFHKGAAFKGTLLALDNLPLKTIEYYKSMQKVESDRDWAESISSFELVSTSGSRNPRVARLSQDLIVLLSIGKVPGSVFLQAVEKAIDQAYMIVHDRARAHQEVLEWESENAEATLHMIAAGIPLEEPGLHTNLLSLTKSRLQDFTKGKVPLTGSFYLMGTADPTNTLKPNEIVIFKGEGLVCGTVLVYRAPGKHPGDIHKLEAVHCPHLLPFVGRPRNVVFFSTQGTRPVPDEIAKGDLDGDLYWICKNQEVVASFTEWRDRWTQRPVDSTISVNATRRPMALSPPDLEEACFKEFFRERFYKSPVVGKASTCWLAHVDAFLHPDTSEEDKKIHEEEFLKYPDYIYEGVDMKSGMQLTLFKEHPLIGHKPFYLQKKVTEPEEKIWDNFEGGEKSILGQIYYMGHDAKEAWKSSKLGPEHFQVDPVFYVPNSEQYWHKWENLVENYFKEMAQALKEKDEAGYDPDEPNRIYMSYKKILYEAPSFKERKKDRQTILEEASAIYNVVYNKAAKDLCEGNKPRVAFAWNVAAAPLATIFSDKQTGGNSIVWSPGPYKEVFKRSKKTASAAAIRRPLF